MKSVYFEMDREENTSMITHISDELTLYNGLQMSDMGFGLDTAKS